MVDNKNQILFVVFLPQEWEIYHRRPYWEAMAEHADILVIEPPAGILTAWRKPKRLRDIFRGLKRIDKFNHTIYAYRPYQLVSPGFDFVISFFNGLDRFLMRRQLKKILRRLDEKYEKIVSFVVHVHQQHFSKVLPEAVQCYEVTDLYLIPHGHHELNTNHWYTKRAEYYENKIVKDSELVVTSSQLIYAKLKESHSNIHYMTNAADYDHFVRSTNEPLIIPDELNRLPRPRIGFIGYINHLIDFELITKLAASNPDASIIMIGAEQTISKVTQDPWYKASLELDNVHYLGFKKYETLPEYLKGFDVCLMPFRLNDWMKHSAPNKTYQYLASGKPIVSTDFTEVRQYSDVIYVAKSHDDFVEMVGIALGEKDESKIGQRQKVALENSTENRARKIIELVSKTTR